MNWAEITYPSRIAALPRNDKGIPIPYFVGKANNQGYRDLRFADMRKAEVCAKKRVCWVCGQPLGFLCCFIGGEVSAQSLTYSDGPMHRECSEFSLTYCPFLATPQMGYSHHNVPANVAHPSHATPQRSAKQVLIISEGFVITRAGRGGRELFFKPAKVVEKVFWKEGKIIPAEPTIVETDFKQVEERVASTLNDTFGKS